MKRIFIICLLTTISLGEVFSQNSLSGTVKEKNTNEPLLGATIYLSDIKRGAATDENGSYKVDNLPKGSFLVEVRYVGYNSKIQKVTIAGDTKFDITLDPSAIETKAIVITGVSAATERNKNPVPSDAVSKKDLYEISSTNVVDAIAKEPGVSQITTGAGISKPIIRGLGFNRILVLKDGIRQEGQQWGEEHGIEIDEYSVERTEIIKGPGSLMYGSDALGGVINFLSPLPPADGQINGNFTTNYQSNNHMFGWSLMNSGNLNSINWLARVSQVEAGNYTNAYDGRVFNSGFKELNFDGSLGINKKWGYSHLNVSSFNQKLGLVEGERDDSGRFTRPVAINDSTVEDETVSDDDLQGYRIDVPYQTIHHFRLSSDNSIFFGESRLSVNLGFQQNLRREFGDPINPDKAQLFFHLNTYSYDIKYFFPDNNGWETTWGVGGMYQNNENKGEEFLVPEYNLFDIGTFVFTQKTFDKFLVSGGLRYDLRDVYSKSLFLDNEGHPTTERGSYDQVKFKSFQNNFSNISGSAGLSYSPNSRVTLRANIARGFRAPNIAELGSNGAHEGTFRYEIGNSDLKPETSLQTDLGFLYNSDHVAIQLSAFNNAINNFIFSQKLTSSTGGDSVVVDELGDAFSAFQFVQGKSNLYGGEASIDIHPHPLDWLHFENSFSFVRGVQLNQPDSMKNLPFIPAPRIQSEIKTDFKHTGNVFKNGFAKVGIEYHFAQNHFYEAFNTETATPSYLLVNAAIGGDVVSKKGKTLFSIFLIGNNLLDKAYQNHLSRLKYGPENPVNGRIGVYNMGRNFNVKLVVPMSLKG